jgi:hypothetical protein
MVISILLMTGCRNLSDESIKPNNDSSDVIESTEVTIPSVSVEFTEEMSEPVNLNEFDAKNQYNLGDGIFTSPQIPETLIYHSPDCKIYAKNIIYDAEDCRITFSLENNGNETIRVENLYLSVNDWMITNITNSADIIFFQPNTTTEFHVSFALDELKFRHISAINELLVTFEVENEMTQLIVLRTNENEESFSYQPKGNVIYDDNDIKAIVPEDGCVYDGKLCLYVENSSNETIYFDCVASSINNKDDSGLTKGQVIILPRSKEIVPVSIWNYDIKKNDTLKVECYSIIYDLDNHVFSDSELKYGDQYTINITT